MIRGTSSAGMFDIYESAKVLGLGDMEEIVCDRDYFILNALFDFEQMKRLAYWSYVKMY